MANTVGKYASSRVTAAAFVGVAVAQMAFGTHSFAADSAAGDTLDVCKLPGHAVVLKAEVFVDGVLAPATDVTLGYEGQPAAFSGIKEPVFLRSTQDVTVRATSVAAADFPANKLVYVIVHYMFEYPKP